MSSDYKGRALGEVNKEVTSARAESQSLGVCQELGKEGCRDSVGCRRVISHAGDEQLSFLKLEEWLDHICVLENSFLDIYGRLIREVRGGGEMTNGSDQVSHQWSWHGGADS